MIDNDNEIGFLLCVTIYHVLWNVPFWERRQAEVIFYKCVFTRKVKRKSEKMINQADISDTVRHGSEMGTVSCLLNRMFLNPPFF